MICGCRGCHRLLTRALSKFDGDKDRSPLIFFPGIAQLALERLAHCKSQPLLYIEPYSDEPNQGFDCGFKMKTDKKDEARILRRCGKSVKVIAREIGVAYSSVSTWVRDVPLTDEQKSILLERGMVTRSSGLMLTGNCQESVGKGGSGKVPRCMSERKRNLL